MSTVGTVVLVCLAVLGFELYRKFEAVILESVVDQVIALAIILALVFGALLPFDILGGFILPTKFSKSKTTFQRWFIAYLLAVTGQFFSYIILGVLVVNLASFRPFIATLGFTVLSILVLLIRNMVISCRLKPYSKVDDGLRKGEELARSWLTISNQIFIVNREDIGYTGGIIGFGRRSKILIPRRWLSFGVDVLATIIARRAIAISSFSHTTGVIIALACNISGFVCANLLASSPISSLAWLIEFIAWFNLWTFLSLLILPTFSRSASSLVDYRLVSLKVPKALVIHATETMNGLQDNERSRNMLIETIFHPIPSVERRSLERPLFPIKTWQVARTSLFVSWAGLSLLARAVHCNVGRPDLWLLPPSD
ncbi:MAG: hypothetical protein CMM02_06820 [Rhodopirellula sp.]|nr:hypothetical protein [Rhodopirellula sp.]